MKKLLVAGILSTLALTTTAQTAPSPPQKVEGLTVETPSQTINLPARIYMARTSELSLVQGQYDLHNGKTLTVSTTGHRIYGAIDGLPKAELVAASANDFVARNGQMKMTFRQHENGIVRDVMVVYKAPQEKIGQPAVKGVVAVYRSPLQKTSQLR